VLAGKPGEIERMTKDGNDWSGLEPLQVPANPGEQVKDVRMPFARRMKTVTADEMSGRL
jgi:hypothetical protein